MCMWQSATQSSCWQLISPSSFGSRRHQVRETDLLYRDIIFWELIPVDSLSKSNGLRMGTQDNFQTEEVFILVFKNLQSSLILKSLCVLKGSLFSNLIINPYEPLWTLWGYVCVTGGFPLSVQICQFTNSSSQICFLDSEIRIMEFKVMNYWCYHAYVQLINCLKSWITQSP
jgi:hypothetical protein